MEGGIDIDLQEAVTKFDEGGDEIRRHKSMDFLDTWLQPETGAERQ
ncbi:MAG: hypothetical protein GKR89_34860 [Candidatus Latescibacteria bacterium]|nr:hypothetical protein [Candidatus Latescibacterota bacterium]